MELDLIIKLKAELGTWSKVASEIGVHRNTLYRWRIGKSKPKKTGRLTVIERKRNLSKLKKAGPVQRTIDTSIMNYTNRLSGSKQILGKQLISEYKNLLKNKVNDNVLEGQIIEYRQQLMRERIGARVVVVGEIIGEGYGIEKLAEFDVRNLLIEDKLKLNEGLYNKEGYIKDILAKFKDQYVTPNGTFMTEGWVLPRDTKRKVKIVDANWNFNFQ